MKKKTVKLVLTALLMLVFCIQVYAAALNTNIVDLIRQAISNIHLNYVQIADQEMTDETAKQNNDLAEFFGNEKNRANEEILTHTQNELSRAKQEVDTYTETLKDETSALIDDETDKAKANITSRIDESLNKAKTTIEKEFEKIVRDLNK